MLTQGRLERTETNVMHFNPSTGQSIIGVNFWLREIERIFFSSKYEISSFEKCLN